MRDLRHPAYLLAMSVIGQELRKIHADLLPGEGDRPAGQTVDPAADGPLEMVPCH